MNRPDPCWIRRPLARCLVVIGLGLFTPIHAFADDLRDPVDVAAEMLLLPVDAPVKLFQKLLSDRISSEFVPRIKEASDPLVKDTLTRQQFQVVHAVQKTWTKLSNAPSELDRSVIAGEFRRKKTDALLTETRRGVQMTYFFHRRKAWKQFATLPPFHDFSAAALRLVQKLGVPHSIEFAGDNPSMPPNRLVWLLDGERVLEFSDRRAEYGVYTLVLARHSLWEERKGERRPLEVTPMDPLVLDVIEDLGGDGSSENIVDEIIGAPTSGELPRTGK